MRSFSNGNQYHVEMSHKQTFEFAETVGQIEADKCHVLSIINLFQGDRPRHCPGFKIPKIHGSIPIKGMHYGGPASVFTHVCLHDPCDLMAEGMFALLSCLDHEWIKLEEWCDFFPTKESASSPRISDTQVDGCAGFIMVRNSKKKKTMGTLLQPDVVFCRKRPVPFTQPCPHGSLCDPHARIKYALALASIRDVVPYNFGKYLDLYHQITLYGWSVSMDLKQELSWSEFLLNPELYPQRKNRFCPPFLLWKPQNLIEYNNTQDILDDVILMEATSRAKGLKRGSLDDDMDEVLLSIPSPSRGKRIRLIDDQPTTDLSVLIEQSDYRGFPMVKLTRKSINGKQLFFTFAQYRETARIISGLIHLWVAKGHNPNEIKDCLDVALKYLGDN